MKLLFTLFALALVASLTPTLSSAQTAPPSVPTNAIEMVDAEVKKVDKDAGKVTLKHAEIKSLDMPAMTMVFRVKDDALWAKLAEGTKVKVGIEKALMGYNITHVDAGK